ncbi:hypothetical protein GGU11DRAFT_763960, partial [Lentinula aff. detonsa]
MVLPQSLIAFVLLSGFASALPYSSSSASACESGDCSSSSSSSSPDMSGCSSGDCSSSSVSSSCTSGDCSSSSSMDS